MRTRLTTKDIENIIESIFNGNLKASRLNKDIAYKNPNSENIVLVNEDTGETETRDLADYLNINFYSWKNRVVETSQLGLESRLTPFDSWVQSLNVSMDSSIALVEITDEEVQVSQDIDNATKQAKITFLVQTDKVANLDYYITKIKNELLGNPQTIYNAFGGKLKAYINIGALIYDGEPETIQFGSCIQCSCGFEISYMADALTDRDMQVSISFNGYDGDYLTMPITKSTYQLIFSGNMEPTMERPDLAGQVNTTISWVKSFTFFDFNTELNNKINEIFWSKGAYMVNDTDIIDDPNVIVFIKIQTNGNEYIYKDVITDIEKTITNSDFNITTMQLKGYGKTI